MKNTQRSRHMLYLYRTRHYTLEMVGKRYGISRERVRQILRDYPEYMSSPSNMEHPKVKTKRECPECKKSFYRWSFLKQVFCSRDCWLAYNRARKRSPEESRDIKRKYAIWYYHNIVKSKSNWREIIAERNRKAKEIKVIHRLPLA